jgi:hypothetical protein
MNEPLDHEPPLSGSGADESPQSDAGTGEPRQSDAADAQASAPVAVVTPLTPASLAEDDDEDDEDDAVGESPAPPLSDEEQVAQARQKTLTDSVGETLNFVKEEEAEKEGARNEEYKPLNIRLTRIYEGELTEAVALFVETPEYDAFQDKVFTRDRDGKRKPRSLKDNRRRVWLVSGAPASGREMTALRLAADLTALDPAYRVQTVYLYDDRDKSIQEIAADPNLPPKSVIIFRNEFESGRMRVDALTSRISGLEIGLKERDVTFIFTVGSESEHFPIQRISGSGRYDVLETKEPDIWEVFDRLVSHYFAIDGFEDTAVADLRALRDVNPTILNGFRAVDLARLFRQSEHQRNAALVLKVLREGTWRTQQPRRTWFDNLENLNYRLYALFVVLFDGLDVNWLDQMYELSVRQLRDAGMDGDDQFIDPQRIGQHVMDATLQLRRRGDRIEFIETGYRDVVQRQIENYQRLLWTLADSFIDTIRGMGEQYEQVRRQFNQLNRRNASDNVFQQTRLQMVERDLDNMRRLRDVIAVALAKLGINHRDRLRQRMSDLARDPSTFVVLTASVTLAEIALQREFQAFVVDILSAWTHSGNFDYKWAAAVSISRVYESVTRASPLADGDQQADDTRHLLSALEGLLADLAREHAVYAPEEQAQAKKALMDRVLSELEDKLTQFVQSAAAEDSIGAQAIALYQAASPEERIRLALTIMPDAQKNVDEEVNKLFESQLDSWSNQIRLSVVNTVAYIAMTRPRDMIALVEGWLSGEQNEDPVWQSGFMALHRLFQHTKGLDMVVLERRGFPLLQTFPTLLRLRRPLLTGLLVLLKALTSDNSASDHGAQQHEISALLNTDPLKTALETTLQWYRNAVILLDEEEDEDADDEANDSTLDARRTLIEERARLWEEQVYPTLLGAINYATADQRRQFRQAIIHYWLTQDHAQSERVHRVAHALIARSHIMDGVVIDLPHAPRHGVLIVDTALTEAARGKAFQLAQTLSTMIPLQIMRLGDNRRVYRTGIRTDADGFQHFRVSDLDGRTSFRRPPLIMPLVQPRAADQVAAFTPDNTCFILVCTNRTIADLPDFFATFPAPVARPAQRDRFMARQPRTEDVPAAPKWDWADRLIIISDAEQPIPVDARGSVTFVSSDDGFDYAYSLIARQIGRLLRTMSTPDQMRADIARYLVPDAVPRNQAELEPLLRRWQARLNSIEYTHPRSDASLTIAWLLLARARESQQGCEEAIDIIERMLMPRDSETSRDDYQMGMACARLLFNFFSANPDQLDQTQHSAMLRLLPAFNRAARDYSDLLPIWEVLIGWAEDERWLTLLQPASENATTEPTAPQRDGSRLFESIHSLNDQHARAARLWLNRYDRLQEFIDLYMEIGKPLDAFIAFIRASHAWRAAQSVRRTGDRKRAKATPPPLSEPLMVRLLTFIPSSLDDNTPELRALVWQLERLRQYHMFPVTPGEREALARNLRNADQLVQRLRDQLSQRLAGRLPDLKGEEVGYGVLVFQSDSKTMRAKARDVVRAFVQLRRQGEMRSIVLTVHRIGTGDLLQSIRRTVPKGEWISDDAQKRLPLIGAALDRYRDEQVAFVLVLSEKPVLDYDDWAEQLSWDERLYTLRPARTSWQPVRGEHIDVTEDTDAILAHIANQMKTRTP